MLLKYLYNEKLAHASYLVGCQATGEALVIDPGRSVDEYIELAEANDMRIVAAAETHIHADYVSGARELAERTGATLYVSDEGDADWKYQFVDSYSHRLLVDGDEIAVGNLRLSVMHTPGHTPEHISFLLTDGANADRPMGLFSGDFVFVGSVGRPDLLEKAAGIEGTAESGARQMFRSIQRFRELPDYLQLWPAHGAGSACGKGLGSIPSTTVGYEKLFNPMLQIEDEETFVRALLADQPESPRYFAVMKRVNKEGPSLLQQEKLPQLSISSLLGRLRAGAQVVDTRGVESFAAGHLPGTINIPADMIASWAGWLLDYDHPYYLIVEPGQIGNVYEDLTYIGLDRLEGYVEMEGGLKLLTDAGTELQSIESRTPEELAQDIDSGKILLVDVRNQTEWDEVRIPGAQHAMLGYLDEQASQFINGKPIAVNCRTGRRSAIGASLLQARGAERVINMEGGITRWQGAGLPVVEQG